MRLQSCGRRDRGEEAAGLLRRARAKLARAPGSATVTVAIVIVVIVVVVVVVVVVVITLCTIITLSHVSAALVLEAQCNLSTPFPQSMNPAKYAVYPITSFIMGVMLT